MYSNDGSLVSFLNFFLLFLDFSFTKSRFTLVFQKNVLFALPTKAPSCKDTTCSCWNLQCASSTEYTDGLLLKTIPFPDLVVIEEENSELVQSKDLCVICMESESTRDKLLVTRCCQQFPHIFHLSRYYCIADVCSTQDYADQVTAKLYSENCFVCCSFLQQEAPLNHFTVQHLTPEINPKANDRRIQDANATLSSRCAGLTSKISPLFSSCKAGYLRYTYAVDQYSSVDGYVKEITPDLPTVRIFQPREFQEEVLQCIKQILKDLSGLQLNQREFRIFPLTK